MSLKSDSKREGSINFDETTNRWVWGKDGVGAVIMPNKDNDQKEINSSSSITELVPIRLKPVTECPQEKEGYSVRLNIDRGIGDKISIYRLVDDELQLVLGKDRKEPNTVK